MRCSGLIGTKQPQTISPNMKQVLLWPLIDSGMGIKATVIDILYINNGSNDLHVECSYWQAHKKYLSFPLFPLSSTRSSIFQAYAECNFTENRSTHYTCNAPDSRS